MLRWINANSPNQSGRDGETIRMIVLHSTEGNFDGAVEWLCNKDAKASAHYVVGRNGDIAKLVPLTKKAWHVRKSIQFGGTEVNKISVGIEIESYTGAYDYPEDQIKSLARLVHEICEEYEIRAIVAHRDLDPTRRTDPVTFPWDRFWRSMEEPGWQAESSNGAGGADA